MHSDIRIINPLKFSGWDRLIGNAEGHSFFHTSAWAKVLCETYGYIPHYFSLIEDGILKIAVPFLEVKSFITGTRGVSLPFTDFCEPLISEKKQQNDIFNFIIDYGAENGWRSVETRGWELDSEKNQCASPVYLHSLSLLPGEKELFKSFRDSTRRNVRKAKNEGVSVSIDNTFAAVKDFYHLNLITRRNHGLPPQPFRLFQNIYEYITTGNLGFVCRAFHRNKCIAAAIFFHTGENAIYKYGASDGVTQHLRGNYLIMWEAIKHCSKMGIYSLSLGITEPGNKGLMQFKSGWTKKVKTILRRKYYIKKKEDVLYRSHVKGFHNLFFNKMPLPVSKLIGTILYRHMG